MAEEKQPPGVVEGATTGDVEDEMLDDKAKSAEDRKAAAALSKLDARGDDDDDKAAGSVDQEGLSKAMNKLGVSKQTTATQQKKAVKVDKADVQLLVSSSSSRYMCCWGIGADCVNFYYFFLQVDELDLTAPKATDLLKQHDGDAVTAMKAFIAVK